MNRARRLLRGLEPPSPPRELRSRTLAAAGAAARRGVPGPAAGAPALLDRLWESRALRLAWGLAVAGLVLLNWGLDRGPAKIPAPARRSAAPVVEAAQGAPLFEAREEILRRLLGPSGARRTRVATGAGKAS